MRPRLAILHAAGPDALFVGKEGVINAVFEALASVEPRIDGLA